MEDDAADDFGMGFTGFMQQKVDDEDMEEPIE